MAGVARGNDASAQNKAFQFKLVLLGESAVGKSSLVLRFVKGQFHDYQESTIGGNYVNKLCRSSRRFAFELRVFSKN